MLFERLIKNERVEFLFPGGMGAGPEPVSSCGAQRWLWPLSVGLPSSPGLELLAELFPGARALPHERWV